MIPYQSPLSSAQYPQAAAASIVVGFILMTFYFNCQLKGAENKKRGGKNADAGNLFVELSYGFFAAIFLGFGTYFAILSFGLLV
jgi:hypothetical protein